MQRMKISGEDFLQPDFRLTTRTKENSSRPNVGVSSPAESKETGPKLVKDDIVKRMDEEDLNGTDKALFIVSGQGTSVNTSYHRCHMFTGNLQCMMQPDI